MSNVNESDSAAILVKCGRRCCICRRFNPLRLQIHHIVEESRGGSGDPDNLIPICLTCHQDVHTQAPFSRRFSSEELKLHREQVFRAVADGTLIGNDTHSPIFEWSRMDLIVDGDEVPRLIPEAMALLVEAATKESSIMDPGELTHSTTVYDREFATQRKAFKQLCDCGLIEYIGGICYNVSYEGFIVADKLMTLNAAAAKD